jgi:hypothetical protein
VIIGIIFGEGQDGNPSSMIWGTPIGMPEMTAYSSQPSGNWEFEEAETELERSYRVPRRLGIPPSKYRPLLSSCIFFFLLCQAKAFLFAMQMLVRGGKRPDELCRDPGPRPGPTTMINEIKLAFPTGFHGEDPKAREN